MRRMGVQEFGKWLCLTVFLAGMFAFGWAVGRKDAIGDYREHCVGISYCDISSCEDAIRSIWRTR